MSHHTGHHGDDSVGRRHSEGEGFFEKVKEFFTGGAEEGDAYESRHGNGVDDSGVLADAPLEDDPADWAAGAPDDSETKENPDWADTDNDESGDDDPTEGETTHETAAQPDGGEAQDDGGGGQQDDSSEWHESGFDEIRDGGHGWGSAAPIEGGAMPLGHPVKAWHDTLTYLRPGEDGYEGADTHEWFVDDEAAQRAGFRHAHGG